MIHDTLNERNLSFEDWRGGYLLNDRKIFNYKIKY